MDPISFWLLMWFGLPIIFQTISRIFVSLILWKNIPLYPPSIEAGILISILGPVSVMLNILYCFVLTFVMVFGSKDVWANIKTHLLETY